MVNTAAFSQRLHKILEYYELSAAGFADKIEVGRSSISHILSGRNKPSLDFVMKIVTSFPEVELYWLLNGKGSFPASDKEENNQQMETKATPASLSNDQISKEQKLAQSFIEPNNRKAIRKIVIFYEDGTFEAFQN